MADTVRTSGPLFTGETSRELERFVETVKWELGRAAETSLRAIAATDFKSHPTYKWERELFTVYRDKDVVVQDNVIYNNWLEGVGSRNESTRFKGYHLWRRAFQRLQQSAPTIIRDELRKHAAEAGIEVT